MGTAALSDKLAVMGRTSQRKGVALNEKSLRSIKILASTPKDIRLVGRAGFVAVAMIWIFTRAERKEEASLVAEVKARKNGGGFTTLESWLSDYDCSFLKRNNGEPLVVLPWRVWRSLLERL
jgi:hypothetical protein